MTTKRINLKRQTIIILDGPMGSGKTSISSLLHKRINNLASLGCDDIKWIQSDFKRSDKEINISLEVLLAMVNVYLKNKMSVLIAENFIDKNQRNKFISLAKGRNVDLFIYHLHAPKEELLKRIANRRQEHEKMGIPPIKQSFILKNLKLHGENKHIGARVFDTSKNSIEDIVNSIIEEIK